MSFLSVGSKRFDPFWELWKRLITEAKYFNQTWLFQDITSYKSVSDFFQWATTYFLCLKLYFQFIILSFNKFTNNMYFEQLPYITTNEILIPNFTLNDV